MAAARVKQLQDAQVVLNDLWHEAKKLRLAIAEELRLAAGWRGRAASAVLARDDHRARQAIVRALDLEHSTAIWQAELAWYDAVLEICDREVELARKQIEGEL